MRYPEISVIIPTYRRPHLLSRLLTSLYHQSIDWSRFEVIIADDAPDEKTRELVQLFVDETPMTLRYISVTSSQGPAAARNRGWEIAFADIIAFTDDDTITNPTWLEEVLKAFDDEKLIAAWGKISVPLPDRPTDYEKNMARLNSAEFATANCFCRKEWLVLLDGFDEHFTTAWREDSDLYFRLLEAINLPSNRHLNVSYLPHAIVQHPSRQVCWGISIKEQGKSQFNALLYKKHPQLYRKRIQKWPPLRYYLLSFLVLSIIVSFFVASSEVSVLLLVFWLWINLSFFIQRIHGTSKKPRHILEVFLTSFLIPYLSIFWRIRGAFKFRVFFL